MRLLGGKRAMTKKIALVLGLVASLALAACNSGPSSSGPAPGEDEAALLERKADYIEGLLGRRGLAGDILEGLIAPLPDRVRLSEAAFDSGEIQVKGSAPSNNLLADYIARLEGSPSLRSVALRSSSMRIVDGRETWEFELQAVGRESGAVFKGQARKETASTEENLGARLEKLEKSFPARQESADRLREIQRLVLDCGLQMTKFAPGNEVAGEFTVEMPVAIEVQGDLDEFNDFVCGLAGLPSLWIVDRFSFRALAPDGALSGLLGCRFYLNRNKLSNSRN